MLVEFAAVMMPTSAVMGFALATVGFTCWNLAVPLFLNLFSFHIFDALLLVVLMDLAGSLALVLLYSRRGRVDYGFVLRFGPLCAIVAFTSAKLGEAVLLAHQAMLKGSVGYIPFLYAAVFFVKGYRSLRADGAVEPAPLPVRAREFSDGVSLTRGHNTNSQDSFAPGSFADSPFNASFSSARTSSMDDVYGVEMGAASPGGASAGAPAVVLTPRGARREAPADGAWAAPAEPKRACLRQAFAAVLRSPILEAEARRVSPAVMLAKLAACAALVTLCGIIGGILYFGGGVIFVTVILSLFYTEDLPLVTGTGCALMSCVCVGLLLTFVDRPVPLDGQLHVYAGLLLPCVVLGTAVSSHAMLFLSRTSVLLLVSVVALLMGVLITFQAQIFSWAVGGTDEPALRY